MKTARLIALLFCTLLAASAQKTVTYVDAWRPFQGPQAYKDPRSGTILYVESDGRHVAAISKDGRLLWSRDPFADAHLEPYRTETPQIVFIGPPLKWMKPYAVGRGDSVAITYNSSQFGLLNISTGDFHGLGED